MDLNDFTLSGGLAHSQTKTDGLYDFDWSPSAKLMALDFRVKCSFNESEIHDALNVVSSSIIQPTV